MLCTGHSYLQLGKGDRRQLAKGDWPRTARPIGCSAAGSCEKNSTIAGSGRRGPQLSRRTMVGQRTDRRRRRAHHRTPLAQRRYARRNDRRCIDIPSSCAGRDDPVAWFAQSCDGVRQHPFARRVRACGERQPGELRLPSQYVQLRIGPPRRHSSGTREPRRRHDRPARSDRTDLCRSARSKSRFFKRLEICRRRFDQRPRLGGERTRGSSPSARLSARGCPLPI